MPPQSVVDDRVFLIGLDELYRQAMRRHEREELLQCAREVAAALGVAPADVPVEGYYADDPSLIDYFRLLRGLQEVAEIRKAEVAGLAAFRRLSEVTSARLFGHPQYQGKLFPVGRDALSHALLDSAPDWGVARLVEAAYHAARATDDFSLVGLAARARDAVAMAALRESVVLYAEVITLGAGANQTTPGKWTMTWPGRLAGSWSCSMPSLVKPSRCQ